MFAAGNIEASCSAFDDIMKDTIVEALGPYAAQAYLNHLLLLFLLFSHLFVVTPLKQLLVHASRIILPGENNGYHFNLAYVLLGSL